MLNYDDKGYVIREVDSISGEVLYRGAHGILSYEKDALHPGDTYTFSGAKRALKNLQRIHQDGEFFSMEKLSCYYINFMIFQSGYCLCGDADTRLHIW